MSALSFERIESGATLGFWAESPHASAFTHPRVLEALAGEVHWWACRKGLDTLCVWPSAPAWARRGENAPWTMYVGPMWSSRALRMPAHRWLAVSQAVHRGLAERMLEVDGALHAQLPPGLDDVRAFQWAAREGALPGLQLRPQYSAVVEAIEQPEAEIVGRWRAVRRREMKRAQALDARLRFDPPAATVERIYAGVFARQGVTVPAGQWETLPALLQLARSGLGTAFSMEVGGRTAFAAIMLYDRHCAHLALSAADAEFRGSGITALATLEAIRLAVRHGLRRFDFDGANSPLRGDDKHSYGATTQIYFELGCRQGPHDAA